MKVENQLLARLARAVGVQVEPEAVAPVEAPVEAVTPVEGADTVVEAGVDATSHVAALAEIPAQVLELATAEAVAPFAAKVIEMTAQLETVLASLTEMTAKYEGASVALAGLVAEKELALVQAGITKMNARKVKVEAAIGTEKAPGLLAATDALDDAQFEAVVVALAGSVDAEAQSPLFKEVGATGVVDAANTVEESAEMKILKQKYGAK